MNQGAPLAIIELRYDGKRVWDVRAIHKSVVEKLEAPGGKGTVSLGLALASVGLRRILKTEFTKGAPFRILTLSVVDDGEKALIEIAVPAGVFEKSGGEEGLGAVRLSLVAAALAIIRAARGMVLSPLRVGWEPVPKGSFESKIIEEDL